MRKIINFIENIKFIFKNKSLPGVLIVLYRFAKKNKKEFLLVKSSSTQAITFPSGCLSLFEDFYDAAIRELIEETGIKIEKNQLISTPLIHRFTYQNLPLKIKSQQKIFLVFLKRKKIGLNPLDKHIVWRGWYNEEKTYSLLSYLELKRTFMKINNSLKKKNARKSN